jgi:hypothetical protein
MQQNLSRRAWTLFEPVHGIVYFAPEPHERYREAGLRGGWMGYFASRSAPMGAVGPDVVTAIFHGFKPAMVHRAIPDAWTFSTPERVLAARLDGADGALRRLWGAEVDSPAVREAAELALDAANHLTGDGRPLYAAHAALAVPSAPHLALWHACTLLREHRFEGHVTALTVHGVRGDEALVIAIAAGNGVDAAMLRSFRGWNDEEWSDAQRRLRDRGVLDGQDSLTAEGNVLRDAVEETTDRLAAGPWAALDPARRERLFELLGGLVAKLDAPGGIVYPNPVGVPRPSRGL